MRKGICLNLVCQAVNRLPKGWKPSELRCGKCGDAIRGTRPASAEKDLQPVTMAEAGGTILVKPEAPPAGRGRAWAARALFRDEP